MRESTVVSHPRANVANVEVLVPLHSGVPETPPRLDRIFDCYDPPLYFVTFNTHQHGNYWQMTQSTNASSCSRKSGSLAASASGAMF